MRTAVLSWLLLTGALLAVFVLVCVTQKVVAVVRRRAARPTTEPYGPPDRSSSLSPAVNEG